MMAMKHYIARDLLFGVVLVCTRAALTLAQSTRGYAERAQKNPGAGARALKNFESLFGHGPSAKERFNYAVNNSDNTPYDAYTGYARTGVFNSEQSRKKELDYTSIIGAVCNTEVLKLFSESGFSIDEARILAAAPVAMLKSLYGLSSMNYLDVMNPEEGYQKDLFDIVDQNLKFGRREFFQGLGDTVPSNYRKFAADR